MEKREIARIDREIESCRNGDHEAPAWQYAMGMADWEAERRLVWQEQYRDFLESKRIIVPTVGIQADQAAIHPLLHEFQKEITLWALRKGRCAIFADTGLGKTFMQIEWARLLDKRTLIVAPLAVAKQTVREAAKLDCRIQYVRSANEVSERIAITNYEMIEEFSASRFEAVVLDESSILKALDGKTRNKLTAMFSETPYRLCCTATPAPNDITEIANHAEFLSVMSRQDMLSAFFLHESNKKNAEGWRLKRPAEDPFYRWLASWSISLRMPSDLGFSDDGYALPPLRVSPLFVHTDFIPEGMLFAGELKGLGGRLQARRAGIEARCQAIAAEVNASSEQWILWCGMNEESNRLAKLISGAVEISGSDSRESKEENLLAFVDGQRRVIVTKPRIAGWGLNLQNCHRQAFVGLGDSWEQYYQCIRRSWRFGQTQPVDVRIVLSEAERDVLENVRRKDRQAEQMHKRLIRHVKGAEMLELKGEKEQYSYETAEANGEGWRLLLGDSVERLKGLPTDSVGLSVFSPPFLSLYSYTPTERDLGNSTSHDQFFAHFRFIIAELLRVTQPGRNCCCHVAQVPATAVHDGFIGLKDFRGRVVSEFVDGGWTYHGEVVIDKNPQAQAIRTHSKGLLFVQLRKDASWLRPGLADYILVFRKPGENANPILPDVSNEEWITWAHPIWYGIQETETLNTAEGKGQTDERHICPLQLGTIERCIRLWSNPGDLILSPFAGIGSEGYVAVQHDRKFIGIELKKSYWQTAVKNLRRAIAEKPKLLFDAAVSSTE